MVWFSESLPNLGSVYTERQRQCCDVTSGIDQIKLFRILNKPNESFQK